MKKIYFLSLFIITIIFSCSSDEQTQQPEKPDDNNGNNNPDTEETLPDWNKNKTAVVYLFSNFKDEALKEQNYEDARFFLKLNSNFQAAILSQSDVDMSKNYNGGVYVTSRLKEYSFFNLENISTSIIKGNTTIVKTPIEELTNYENSSLSISNTDSKVTNSIDFPLSVTKIKSSTSLSASENLLKKVINENRVLFLTINESSVKSLTDMVKGIKDTYRVQDYKAANNKSIVIICPKNWYTREVKKIKDYTENMSVYKLQVEANVF